nr:hypothetical protein Iba_chr09fCG11530 [Ipomoea batatas]
MAEVTRPPRCSTFRPKRRGKSRHVARCLVLPGAAAAHHCEKKKTSETEYAWLLPWRSPATIPSSPSKKRERRDDESIPSSPLEDTVFLYSHYLSNGSSSPVKIDPAAFQPDSPHTAPSDRFRKERQNRLPGTNRRLPFQVFAVELVVAMSAARRDVYRTGPKRRGRAGHVARCLDTAGTAAAATICEKKKNVGDRVRLAACHGGRRPRSRRRLRRRGREMMMRASVRRRLEVHAFPVRTAVEDSTVDVYLRMPELVGLACNPVAPLPPPVTNHRLRSFITKCLRPPPTCRVDRRCFTTGR